MTDELDTSLVLNGTIDAGLVIGSSCLLQRGWSEETREIGVGFVDFSTVSGMGSNSSENASLTEGIKEFLNYEFFLLTWIGE